MLTQMALVPRQMHDRLTNKKIQKKLRNDRSPVDKSAKMHDYDYGIIDNCTEAVKEVAVQSAGTHSKREPIWKCRRERDQGRNADWGKSFPRNDKWILAMSSIIPIYSNALLISYTYSFRYTKHLVMIRVFVSSLLFPCFRLSFLS